MADVIEDEEGVNPVVTERVQALAQGIYDEFQSMVGMYGPESIGNLMPLVVNVLEDLDSALADNKDHLTALEETNEENQQLSQQYKKEKQRRKQIEEKSVRMEDLKETEVNDLTKKVSSLGLLNKNLTSKNNGQKEQIERLEEKHEALWSENKDLHVKHIVLIKEYQEKIETIKQNTAIKLAEACGRSTEDPSVECSSPSNPPGFQDFTAPSISAVEKRKRQLPIAPRRRPRGISGEGEDEMFLSTTPFHHESPEFNHPSSNYTDPFCSNTVCLHDEQQKDEELFSNGGTEEEEEDANLQQLMEEFQPNEDSLLAELHLAATGTNVPGVDQILFENEKLHTDKLELAKEVDELRVKYQDLEAERNAAQYSSMALQDERDKMANRLIDMDMEMKLIRTELEEEQEKGRVFAEGEGQMIEGPGGMKLTRLEVARVLRERNEYKEKYLSLLEQIRMSDELSLFKPKSKKSRWLDYFTAVFSPAKRRQLEQTLADSTPRRSILPRWSPGSDDDDGGGGGGFPQAGAAGYRKTNIIPVLKKTGKRQDEMYMTSVSWVIPALERLDQEKQQPQPSTPSINTCRPMSYQEDGAKILCTAAVNPATFIDDCADATEVVKDSSFLSNSYSSTSSSSSQPPSEATISLVWIVTGVPNLTKVSVVDVATMGEVLDTFPVCASPISCIAAVPGFNSTDPDILAGLSTARRKACTAENLEEDEQQADINGIRPSSQEATMWMGSDTGVLYVHSALSNWKKCIHADKLPAPIISISYLKGKVVILLQNSNLAIFRRFPGGDWDWDNYSLVVLTQRRDISASAMAAVKYNVWCAVGNMVHVVQSLQLKMEASIPVHQARVAVVTSMVCVGDGVWISFKLDSTLRLFNACSFTHMQDLDIAPSVHKLLVFGSEKRSSQMPIQISTMVAAHSSLWVGTENGVLIAYPFTTPSMVVEEPGWEFIKEAEVGGQAIPEPFDVRTEEGLEVGASWTAEAGLDVSHDSGQSSDERGLSQSVNESPIPNKALQARPEKAQFNPFCNVDQVELSIHCHINTVKSLLCVPGMVPKDLAMYEPLGGVYIGSGDMDKRKPTLFVVSCGEGHLDLRTADKVLQTLQATESGQSGLPSPATILSDKNYIMVWDINNS